MKIKRWNRSASLFQRESIFYRSFIRLSCFVLALVLLMSGIVFAVSLYFSASGFMQTASDNAKRLELTAAEVFSQMEDICNYISLNEDVRFLLLDQESNENVEMVQDDVTFLLSQLSVLSPYIHSIYIYKESSQTLFDKEGTYSVDKLADTGWMDAYKETNNSSFVPRKMYERYPNVITFIKKIRLNTDNGGAVILNLDTKSLMPDLKDATESFYIIDDNNKIILSSIPDRFLTDAEDDALASRTLRHGKSSFSVLLSKTPYVASVTEKNAYGLSAVSVMDISGKASRILLLQLLVTLLCIALLLLSAYIVYRINRHYYTPFALIKSILDNPPENSSITSNDSETQYIANKIIDTMKSNRVLRTEITDYVDKTSRLSIRLMQSQLNPHFLYNTMNIISLSLVKKLGAEDSSVEAMNKLSSLMRYTMDLSSETQNVRTEIRFLKLYSDILTMRSGENLTLGSEIESSVMDALVPKMCFQPLVENAFVHGLMPSKKDTRTLRISGRKENDVLHFTIEDNGVGISPEQLLEIKNKLRQNDNIIGMDSHIGISNVNSRIKLLYGDDYGIDIESTPDEGTRVFITLPYRKAKE